MELPAQSQLAPAWREISVELRRIVGESTYEIWLAPLEAKEWDGAVLVLHAPIATQNWVAKRFGRVLESCASAVLGSRVQIAFAAGPQSPHERTSAQALEPRSATKLGDALNPRYNFDQFVIGDGNRLAHGAALAVAELPGQAYNPLFLNAPPGLGKTHLLHAIGNYILAFGGGSTVRYTTAESFTNHFITALGSRSVESFKRSYRDADVLLIDDVQFLANKAKTEEEFFHTFNVLYESGRQLVLTADRVPWQLGALQERLRERFESGLVAEIRPPDFATRLTILRKRAALDRVVLADTSVLSLIARRVTDNVRALEGALIRIVAHHSLSGKPIDLELTAAVLDDMHPEAPAPAASAATIQAKVAAYYGISVLDLVSPSRLAHVAWPRQVAIHLTRELTDSSLQEIGAAFGGRNHTTVLHACKRVSQRLMQSPEATRDVNYLAASLSH